MESDTPWERSLKASSEQRMAAHCQCKLRAIPNSLCATCRAINFEYFFFGDAATGRRRNHHEALCLGSLAAVIERSRRGCELCTSIILKQARHVLDIHAPSTGCPQPTEGSWLVYLNAIHHAFARDAPDIQRSEGLYVTLKPGGSGDSDLIGKMSVIENWGHTLSYSSASFLCLIDHDLSAYKLVQPFVELSSCRSWLQSCLSAHDRCGKDLGALTQDDTTRFNTHFKLIDVEARYIVRIGDSNLVRYATLSYVWGNSLTTCAIPRNSRDWERDEAGNERHPLPVFLPQTLRDAIVVTAGLGLEYLWIDWLCITQDDPAEKKVQIEDMSDIYRNATICIIAASGVDSHAGLPGISLSRSLLPGFKIAIREGVSVHFPYSPFEDIIEQYRWLGRAWTFQELVFSKRCLIFTEAEAFYACNTLTQRESLIENTDPARDQWPREISNIKFIRGKDRLYSLYRAAVNEYTRRSLSYQTDALNAFQGLSGFVGRLLGAEVIFGVPKCMLIISFAWRLLSPTMDSNQWPKRRMVTDKKDEGDNDKHSRPLFPSWSWVAWEGKLRLNHPQAIHGSHAQILAPAAAFSPLPAAYLDLKHHFATKEAAVGDSDQRIEILDGIIPVLTKVTTFCVIREEQLGIGLEVQTETGLRVGECDVEGHMDLGDFSACRQTFIQMWVGDTTSQKPYCTVLLVKLFPLPIAPTKGMQQANSGESSVVSVCNPSLPIAVDAQATLSTFLPQRATKITYPPSLCINYQCGKKFETLLACRLGVGFVDLDAWMSAKPRDALVFLG